MTLIPQGEGQEGNVQSAIDPISRVGAMSTTQAQTVVIHLSGQQILQRTQTSSKPQPAQSNAITYATSLSDEPSDRYSIEPEAPRRSETLPGKAYKDKKKGSSFLSRIIGNKRREDVADIQDNVSEAAEDRSGGVDAEVFSQPAGNVTRFPAPPRYIRVKAQNAKQRDLDRLFLAQILLDPPTKVKPEVDSKIHNINENPTIPPPNSSSKTRDNAIWAAEFSRDGKYIAAAGQDKVLRVWEVISTKDVKDEEDHSESGSDSGQSVKLNAPVFKQKLIREYDGHTAAVLDLSWSKNNFLLSSSMDKTVRLYHVSRTDCLCAFKHNDFVTSIQFHPRDDRFFLAGSLDSKLRLWSIPDKSVAYWAQVPDMITAVAFTPDGKTAAAGTLSGLCILYNTEGLKAHSQIHVRSSRGRNTKGSKITGIDTIAIPGGENGQPDVKILITSNDSRIRMYNLKDRTLELKLRGHGNNCSQIRASFSDDGRFVVCGSEDRKVYIWPTGPVEGSDTDRRPTEVFEAHSQIVTAALFAPTKTRKLLALSADPIYDVCNPQPAALLNRADSIMSIANTARSGHSEEKQLAPNSGSGTDLSVRQVDSSSYLARHAHQGGHIIVTADFSGQIKVFRQDCAYQRRRDITWDTCSTFSKRMLNRSGSLTPRTSVASSNHRASFGLSSKNPSADRINNWRDSIANTNGASEMQPTRTNSSRSISPHRSIRSRLSIRYSHANSMNGNSPSISPQKPYQRQPSPPEVTVQSPVEPGPESPGQQPGPETSKHSPPPIQPSNSAVSEATHPTSLSPLAESQHSQKNLFPFSNRDSQSNPLFLIGEQSYQAWDVAATVLPMVQSMPRTPGLASTERNALSRANSMVSQLTSELPTPSPLESVKSQSSSGQANPQHSAHAKGISVGSTVAEDEELRCRQCGSEQFKIVRVDDGEKGLKCRRCGSAA